MTDNDATRWLVGGLVVLGVLLLAGPLLFGAGGMMGGATGGMWGPMHDGRMGASGGAGTGWWFLAALWRLLLLAVIVGGGYLLYRAANGGEKRDPAIEEVRSAYARGDLSEEEYERRRERLEE